MGRSMIKRTFLALALFAGLLSPAYSAGTIGLSLTQRLDAVTAKPLNGGKLYFYQAGTVSTPQNAFQDSALTIPWPNPMTLDAGGNIPQLFFADGQIKIRLTNAAGVPQLSADNILVVGASSGGGGGGSVDPTTVLATGDLKPRYGTGVLSGFVRANGRTIGSSTSGATERANADAQALFEFLWNTDPNLVVSTGRGASSNADWVANKTIALPDWRGRAMAFLNDMGNADSGRLSAGVIASGGGTTLGSSGGLDIITLLTSNLPNIPLAFTGTTATITVVSNDGANVRSPGIGEANGGTGGDFRAITTNPGAVRGTITSTGSYTPVGFATLPGSSAPFNNMPPFMLATLYIKL